MAFNWPVFKTRALTGIVFAAVMLGGLLWNQWSFFILFSVIHFGCWWEYFRLISAIRSCTFHIHTRLGLMLIGYGIMLWFCGPSFFIDEYGIRENISLPVSGAGFILLIAGIFQQQKISLGSFGAAALGLVYLSLSWGLLLDIYGLYIAREGEQYPFRQLIPVAIIVSIWINDTMAYIVGSLIGKTPLSSISPKKTWEGTLGGAILCVLTVGLLFSFVISDRFTATSFLHDSVWYIIAAIAAVMGTIGDLLESKLKRMAGVKDSGSIMPGHGGFLDRFDSLLVAIPFVWLYIRLFLQNIH